MATIVMLSLIRNLTGLLLDLDFTLSASSSMLFGFPKNRSCKVKGDFSSVKILDLKLVNQSARAKVFRPRTNENLGDNLWASSILPDFDCV